MINWRVSAGFLLAAYVWLAPIVPAHAGSMLLLGTGTLTTGCSQATTYLARTSGGNEAGNSVPITALICGLVTDGVITGNLSTTGCGTPLDALYILAQQNSADSWLNLCGTSFTIGQFGANTFTALMGWSGFNISGGSLDTRFNATTATSPHYTQNSASYGFWSVATAVETRAQMGSSNSGATGESNIFDNYTDGNFYARVNNGTTTGVASPGTKGLYVAERPSSTNVIPYWDGIAQATQTSASSSPFNGDFFIGSVPGNVGSAQQFAEAHIGAALGSTLNLALYNRLRTYMTAIGVP